MWDGIKYVIPVTALQNNESSNIVNLPVRVNPTKRVSQQAILERYFLECVS